METLLTLFDAYTAWALVLVAALVAAGVVARLFKRRAHAHGHVADPESSTDPDVPAVA